MKALTRTVSREVSYKDDMREVITPVTQWIKKRHDELTNQASIECERGENIAGMLFAGLLVPCQVLGAWVSVVILGVYCFKFACLADRHHVPFWSAENVIPTVILLCSVGCLAGFAFINKLKRKKAYQRLLSQEERDPLYRRAVLIKEAVGNYGEHCDRYEAGRELATQGVGLIDASAWDEYHAMLERSRTVILQSVENFEAARKHERKIKAFLKIHEPVQSSALSELVGLLDQPLEIPELPGVAALSDELKIGDDLVQLIEELKEGHDFDERLRATTKARVAALEDDLDADAKSEAFISAPCAKKA